MVSYLGFNQLHTHTHTHTHTQTRIVIFTITAEIHARSLAKFYGQYADRQINLKFMCASANESEKFDNLLS